MALTVKRKGDVLRIELSLEKPQLSKSGKTMLVASSHGVKKQQMYSATDGT